MFETACKETLLALASGYAKAEGLSMSTVSRRFHGNQAFLDDFKRGKCSVTLSKLDEMVLAITAAWPAGAKRPKVNGAPGIVVRGKTSTTFMLTVPRAG